MTLISSITKLGSVQNNSMIKSQIGGVSGVNSTQSLNSVACNPGNDVDVHVLLCANILGINIYANVNVDLFFRYCSNASEFFWNHSKVFR
ncbi:hypothetical protein PPL_09253 [Heterostelium album PN500]|uniref:Uncharacterized protein n=1 Tax=Heterostelium pallidum (strain ATCC 26659 / Pp 5 / PN500) TaxID=670386 RepID=D3BL21_HETP5|nr:hypothetical protein PPL_09253 [Heterostelium album PN500]EFA77755.1 hypothetical protein PPL_09253 [Heterostelium album PN500]|eukprot:XP_020429883.1 hypothetical protein PPL_09253 [Heterostelium album PN500]